MKTLSIAPSVLCALLAAVAHMACLAQEATDEPVTVKVRAVSPLAPVAPAWQPDRAYKFGDLVSYDGNAYKAKSGSSHRRPDPAVEIGWEKLNACDDKSKGAVKCEIGNQADTVSAEDKDRKRDEDVRKIEFNSRN